MLFVAIQHGCGVFPMAQTMHPIRHTLVILLALSFLYTRSAPCAPAAETLARVQHLIETGRSDSARVILTELLVTDLDRDERVRALYYLSRAMNQLGSLGEEIKYLIMAREESPGTPLEDTITRDYAQLLLRTANYAECIAVTEQFRSRTDDSPLRSDILSITADAFYANGDYQRAFNLSGDIAETYPDTENGIQAILRQGLCLYQLSLIGGAIDRLETYLARYPEGRGTADALWYLGNCYDAVRSHRLAAVMFKRLTIEYPFYRGIVDVYYRLGENYLAVGQLADAEHAFGNFIANTDSTNVFYDEALLNLERINYRSGRYPDQIAMYEHFITRYPTSSLAPSILFDLARYYTAAGRRDEAIEKYSILFSNREYAAYADSAAFLMADLYASGGERNRAAAFLTTVATGFTDSVRVQKYILRVGEYYESWDDPENAIAWYDSACAIDASVDMSVRALMGVGRILRGHNRLMEAEQIYQRIITGYPEHSYKKDVYLGLSDIYYRAGNIEKASVSAENAVTFAEGEEKTQILLSVAELYEEIDRSHALRLYSIIFNDTQNSLRMKTEALMKFGDLAMRIGDRERASEAYATVIENGADSVSVRQAREKLISLIRGE